MLTRLDDYPVHQTAEPVAHPSTGDRNFYDRYFFNGFSRDGALFFGVALGLYPNRRVMDAAVSVMVDGRQHVVRASRLAPAERTETTVGPITVSVEEPLRRLRVRVAPNPHGVAGDVVFDARTPAVEEPRFTWRVGTRLFMDSTRLTQFGTWDGTLEAGGRSLRVDRASVLGVRDRSWGVRPVGEPEGGAGGMPPQFYWLWAPLHFDDCCTLTAVNEDGAGRSWHAGGSIVPLGERGEPEPLARVAHRVQWRSGTRRAKRAEVELVAHGGEPQRIVLEPIATFQMLGLGYLHPTWGHGMWHGDLAVEGETWTVADLDPMDPRHLHVQAVVRAKWGAREGAGILEQLVLGPHAPSGFTSILDPAT
jgi:hypothetical protein